MIHEGMWVGLHALVLALGTLRQRQRHISNIGIRESIRVEKLYNKYMNKTVGLIYQVNWLKVDQAI